MEPRQDPTVSSQQRLAIRGRPFRNTLPWDNNVPNSPNTNVHSGESSHNVYPSGPSQDPFGTHQYHSPVLSNETHSPPVSNDGDQYSSEAELGEYDAEENEEDKFHDFSEEDSVQGEQTAIRREPRMRRYGPAWQSELSKRLANVPGGAGFNQHQRGCVKMDKDGNLVYLKTDEDKWIPAVYHYQIRESLIAKANAGHDKVYTHPRACGAHHLDVTAFLESQMDWDLERDNGWTGVEWLFTYDFAKSNFLPPFYEVQWMYHDGRVVLDLDSHPVMDYRDIPLTLSSKVEGGLMQAIRDLDPRITFMDFHARLPKSYEKGGIYKVGLLTERTTRFRERNCIPSRKVDRKGDRKGSKSKRDYILSLMSEQQVKDNTTRGLSKLSKAQQAEARRANKGKHDMNAGGYAKGLARTEKPLLKKLAKKPESGSKRFGTNKKQQPKSKPRAFRKIAPWSSSVASPDSQGSSSIPMPKLPLCNPLDTDSSIVPSPSPARPRAIMPKPAVPASSNPWLQPFNGPTFNEIADRTGLPDFGPDFRYIRPFTAEDQAAIQGALTVTRVNFLLRIADGDLPPTPVDQSYDYQVKELVLGFEVEWVMRFGHSRPVPDLVTSREPWRGGFKDPKSFAGGDMEFLNGELDSGVSEADISRAYMPH